MGTKLAHYEINLHLMTKATRFAERVTKPQSHVPKTYRVKASTLLSDAHLQHLRDGIELPIGKWRLLTHAEVAAFA